jgi:hypothetical protein
MGWFSCKVCEIINEFAEFSNIFLQANVVMIFASLAWSSGAPPASMEEVSAALPVGRLQWLLV